MVTRIFIILMHESTSIHVEAFRPQFISFLKSYMALSLALGKYVDTL
jgi:hypothetical protein